MLRKASGAQILQCVEFPIEQPGAGQLRVRVHVAGVGSPELIMLAGKYAYASRRPFVPGYEIAGLSMPSARASRAPKWVSALRR
jgi:NADPH:quinone reductase-like Zn-dependent oxidoreductase